MELEDFKSTWREVTIQLMEKQNFNPKTFDKMSKKKFQSSLLKIALPEILGSIVCIAAAIFIAINFYKLNQFAYKIAGALSILIFLVLPVLSIISIQQLYKGVDVETSYADAIKQFAIRKIKFCRLQKLNLMLSYLLLVSVILTCARIFGRNEITESNYFFVFAFSFGYSFFLVFSKWVSKSYNKTIRQTETLLKTLTE